MKTYKNTLGIAGLVLIVFLPISHFGQDTWGKHNGNPVFSGKGNKADHHCYFPSVLFENGTYKMWYTSADKAYSTTQIAFVKSSDGINWLPSETPFITNMKPATWNRYICSARVIRICDTLKMWYTAYSELSAPSIGYAWSVKENVWNFNPDPVLWHGEPGAFDDVYVFGPSIYHNGTTYHMWYSARSSDDKFNIGYATSEDGIHWHKSDADNPVIKSVGSIGWYCHGVHYPSVVVYKGTYHMWFGGSGYDWEKRIGYATSADGVNWLVGNGNAAVLDAGQGDAWDNQQVHAPCVILHKDRFEMWYAASNNLEGKWKIGYAFSDEFGEFETGDPQALKPSLSASPNPFSGNVLITYELPEREQVTLEVYSYNGQHMTRLDEGIRHSGTYYFHYQPAELPPGMYILVLSTPGKVIKHKMIKVR